MQVARHSNWSECTAFHTLYVFSSVAVAHAYQNMKCTVCVVTDSLEEETSFQTQTDHQQCSSPLYGGIWEEVKRGFTTPTQRSTPTPTPTSTTHPNSQASAEQDAAYLHERPFDDFERPGVHLRVHPCLLGVLHHVLVHTLFAFRTAYM